MTPSNETYQNFFILLIAFFAIIYLIEAFENPSKFNVGITVILGIMPAVSALELIGDGIKKYRKWKGEK